MLVLVVGFVLFAGLFLSCFHYIVLINNSLLRIVDYSQLKNTEFNVYGHNGLFDVVSNNILVRTLDRSNKDVCMTFLHELGHKIDYDINPQLFVEKTIEDKELFANNYVLENAWRCEGI